MAFIIIPIVYIEGTAEEDDEISAIKRKKNPPKILEADICINTQMICSFVGEDEHHHTMVTMGNGNVYECTMDVEEFGDMIDRVETLIDLSDITAN